MKSGNADRHRHLAGSVGVAVSCVLFLYEEEDWTGEETVLSDSEILGNTTKQNVVNDGPWKMELKPLLAQSSSFPTPIFNSSSSSSSSSFPKPNHYSPLLAQRWKLNFRRVSRKEQCQAQAITKKFLHHHVLKDCSCGCRGEDVGVGFSSSISLSELHLMPIFEIVNVDDMEDQRPPHMSIIPSAICGFAQACHFDGNQRHRTTSGVGLHGKQSNQILTVQLGLPAACQLPLAKTTGSFLVLVPIIAALCIRCIVAAFQNRAARNLRYQPARHQGSDENSMRWKTVLSDLQDPEAALGAESEPESSLLMEDKEGLHFEDMSHAYTKLEDEYQKFLSECGMSKWGYWRGGSSQ